MQWERAAAILEMENPNHWREYLGFETMSSAAQSAKWGCGRCVWLDEKGLPHLSRVRARKSIQSKAPRNRV